MLLFLFMILTLIGCDNIHTTPNQEKSVTGPLVQTFGWLTTELEQDPFNVFWSDQIICGEDEHGVESLADIWTYSIQTGDCNWLTIEQPSLRAVHEGDIVRAEVWHFLLSAPEPAMARVGMATDDGIITDIMVPIPQPAGLVELEFRAQTSIAKDTPIYFHISNHGTNSWHLLNIQINPEE